MALQINVRQLDIGYLLSYSDDALNKGKEWDDRTRVQESWEEAQDEADLLIGRITDLILDGVK